MNTTNKYILTEEVIDLVKFKNQNINQLEIWIESKGKDKRNLIKSYQINPKGRIKTLSRNDEEWTAYPPLDFTKSTNSETAEFFYKETLYWTEDDKLDKVQIKDIRTNSVTERTYVFQSSLLVEIDDQTYHKQLFYDNQFRLKESHQKLKILGLEGSTFKTIFIRNANDQIIEKKTKLIFESDTEDTELIETFKYNRYGQLESSIQYSEGNGQIFEAESLFSYLNQDSNKIRSITVFENGKRKSEQNFEYSPEDILIGIKASNSSGLFTRTTYLRK